MKTGETARREFLYRSGGAAVFALMSEQWPSILAAAQHAHDTTKAGGTPHFEVLTSEQARNVEAIAAQIIPSDELPGAREAGVVFFIDRALKTFAKDSRPVYQQGLADVNRMTTAKYPGVKAFAIWCARDSSLMLASALTAPFEAASWMALTMAGCAYPSMCGP